MRYQKPGRTVRIVADGYRLVDMPDLTCLLISRLTGAARPRSPVRSLRVARMSGLARFPSSPWWGIGAAEHRGRGAERLSRRFV